VGWSSGEIGESKGFQGSRTEDELFSRSEHVDGESHLVLIDLQPHPADKAGQDPEDECHGCGWVVSLGVEMLLETLMVGLQSFQTQDCVRLRSSVYPQMQPVATAWQSPVSR